MPYIEVTRAEFTVDLAALDKTIGPITSRLAGNNMDVRTIGTTVIWTHKGSLYAIHVVDPSGHEVWIVYRPEVAPKIKDKT